MRVQANHWLDYDVVALAVLVFGISAVTFLALNLWSSQKVPNSYRVPTGSPDAGKTIGITDVACFVAITAAFAFATMTSTWSLTLGCDLGEGLRATFRPPEVAAELPDLLAADAKRRNAWPHSLPWFISERPLPFQRSSAPACADRHFNPSGSTSSASFLRA
jgi:hypothetical protein